MAYPDTPKNKNKKKKKRKETREEGRSRREGSQQRYHESEAKRLGVSPHQIRGTDEFLQKTEGVKGAQKLRKAGQTRVQRGTAKDIQELRPLVRNLAGMNVDLDKWKAGLPGGKVVKGTPAWHAKKAEVERDVGLMGDYPENGSFQKAQSYRAAQREAGGPVKRNSRDGYARGGLTKVAREDDSAVLMQAGGYLGGLTESGRGTMAGELGRRMPVREAGETMYELSKRRRGFKGGGAVSSYNRRYNNQNK